MVTYLYNVGNNSGYDSIQHVLNVIASDLETASTISQDIIVNVYDGTYAGFTIPDGSTLPLLGTVYRLIIRSSGNYFPIIDFNRSTESQNIGADIGAANPNVTIEGLRFQYFSVGIRSALNSHNIKVNRCIVSNNRNAGIFIDQCNNSQIIQNIVLNGDYGIVSRLCKNSALIHNTVFLNGSITTDPGITKSAIWCQQARDYGNSDHGTLYLIGNIAWNTSGTTLSLFIDDVERGSIKSNFNDWVVGDSAKFISLEDCSFYEGDQAEPRRFYKSLLEWKTLRYDQSSISADPRFFVPVRINSSGNKHAIDLSLLSISSALGLVPSFFIDTQATSDWLPSYVDSSDLAIDILKNPRQQAGTAAGANDRATSSGFFGQDALTSPISSSFSTNCNINPLVDLIQKKMDLWYPKYKVGYFYSYDRDYYLYAKKRCVDIGYLAQTAFNLPSRVNLNKPVKLYINGKKIEDSKYFDIRGAQLVIYHKDLNIINWEEEVELQYFISSWGDSGFFYTETYNRFKIKEGKTRFFLEEDYYPRGPVVITDDTMSSVNKDLFCNREFKIQWDTKEQKAEIIFAQLDNQAPNPQFNYFIGNPPIGWTTDSSMIVSGGPSLKPVAGDYICKLYSGGYIQQQFQCTTGQHTFSIYATSFSGYSLEYSAAFYDNYNRYLGYTKTGEINTTTDWKRYYLTFGNTGSYATPESEGDFEYSFVSHIDCPENSKSMVLKLYSPEGNTYLDAVQYEDTPFPTAFHRKFYGDELTVEYETSSSEYYIDKQQAMSSSISSVSDGFLYIPEIPASAYNGPTSPAVTTLHDIKWKDGRKNIMPWARLFGKDKLRKRTLFHYCPQKRSHPSAPVTYSKAIKDIELVPSTPLALQGSTDLTQVTLIISDEDGNPSSNSKCLISISDVSQKFPGYLHRKIYGAKQQLGQSIYGYTANSGGITFAWIPPSIQDSIIITEVPSTISITDEGEKISFIRTRYPVNLDFHGNVIILDSFGKALPTKSSTASKGIYQTQKRGSYSLARLAYPAVPGTVTLKVNGISYTESLSATPESQQFFVDYENSTVLFPGIEPTVTIEYIRSYVFINQSDTTKIVIFHDKVFNDYSSGTITVGYDFVIKLTANIVDSFDNAIKSKSFDMIAVNYLTTKSNSNSELHLEL